MHIPCETLQSGFSGSAYVPCPLCSCQPVPVAYHSALSRSDRARSLNCHYSMMPVLITAAQMASQSERGMTSFFHYTQGGFIKCHIYLPQKVAGAQDSARGPGHHQILEARLNPNPQLHRQLPFFFYHSVGINFQHGTAISSTRLIAR